MSAEFWKQLKAVTVLRVPEVVALTLRCEVIQTLLCVRAEYSKALLGVQ